MTSLEHSLLAINGVWAAGLHHRHGWRVAALAGCAAALPDWDGLTFLVNRQIFANGHRIWGHNLLAGLLLGLTIGLLDYRFDLTARAARTWLRLTRQPIGESMTLRAVFHPGAAALWAAIAVLAALSHLPADMVVSGAANLADWEVQCLWPFSPRGFVFPLVPWGDPGITIVFTAGLFAAAYRRQRLRPVALVTLLAAAAYMAIRGMLR